MSRPEATVQVMLWLKTGRAFDGCKHFLESSVVSGVSLGLLFGFGRWHSDTYVQDGAYRKSVWKRGKVSGVAGLIFD